MLRRITLAALAALAVSAGAMAQVPEDCFNDPEEPRAQSPANDLQPPEVRRLSRELRITDSDIEAVLDAIARSERKRAAARAPADGGSGS